jgi:hypothetical protein
MIRVNTEYVAILEANSKRDLKLIISDFNIEGIDDEKILRACNKATAQKGQILFVDSVKSQLRYNFNHRSMTQVQQKVQIWEATHKLEAAEGHKML